MESCFFILQNGNRHSAVGMATSHGLDGPEFECRQE